MNLMKLLSSSILLYLSQTTSTVASACLPSAATEITINALFTKGGAGTVVSLCASTTYTINGTIVFTAANQELSTQGHPTGSKRATIQLAVGNDVSTLIQASWLSGVRLLNVIVDGRRSITGLISSGQSHCVKTWPTSRHGKFLVTKIIERRRSKHRVGGGSSGQIISYVASRNPRAWSCLHVIESGNDDYPCTNSTVTYNDIGPCGLEGFDANGNSQWADGISFACTKSLVSHNIVTGSTDGGIVIFGAPGTTISQNTITSSTSQSGFGAINMVDGTYNGNYSGVTVTSNKITGNKMFNIGIAVGASVWGGQSSSTLSGPATISSNTISGNVTFPIAINGWSNGLTVQGNVVSSVTKPVSKFSDLNGCNWPTQQVWHKSVPLSYYSPGITGPLTLQSGFVNSTAGSPTYFLCTQPTLPSSTSWNIGDLQTAANGNIANVHNGVLWTMQGSDGNLVVYNTTLSSATSGWSVLWAGGGAPGSDCNPSGNDNLCYLSFQMDGNLVAYFNGSPYFDTGTNPGGQKLVLASTKPFLSVLNTAGKVLWGSS